METTSSSILIFLMMLEFNLKKKEDEEVESVMLCLFIYTKEFQKLHQCLPC
jgi:hypothetical protein